MVGPVARSGADIVSGAHPVPRVQVVLGSAEMPLVSQGSHLSLESVSVPSSGRQLCEETGGQGAQGRPEQDSGQSERHASG